MLFRTNILFICMKVITIVNEEIKNFVLNENKIWYHGTPDVRDINKSSGFIPKKDTSEFLIIDILSSESPLTIKELHDLFKKRAMFDITYHGIYERTNNLVKREILTKIDNKFSINPLWIKEADEFFNQIKKSYNEHISLNEALGINDVLLLKFNSLQEFDKYLKNFETIFMNNLG